jgi:hypothetical protein
MDGLAKEFGRVRAAVVSVGKGERGRDARVASGANSNLYSCGSGLVVAPAADTLRLQQVAFSVLGVYFVTVAAYDPVYW